MSFLTNFLNRWSPWRLRDEITAQKYHLSLTVDALSRIYKERQFVGLEHETADLMARALTIADPKGDLATVHFRMEDGIIESKHPAFRMIAEMFLSDMEKSGAENYQSVIFHSAKGDIEVLAQFVTGLTPAQKNAALDAQVRNLTLELQLLKDDQRFKAPNDELQKRVTDWMKRATDAEENLHYADETIKSVAGVLRNRRDPEAACSEALQIIEDPSGGR